MNIYLLLYSIILLTSLISSFILYRNFIKDSRGLKRLKLSSCIIVIVSIYESGFNIMKLINQIYTLNSPGYVLNRYLC